MSEITLRLLSSFLCGVILSQTGSLMQVGARNLLASPSTLGIDGLAILWTLILQLCFSMVGVPENEIILSGLGLAGFLLIGFVYAKSWDPRSTFERVVLLGITLNLFVGALFSFSQFVFMAYNFPFPAEIWFGHFRMVTTEKLLILIFWETVFAFIYFRIRREIDLYSLGSGIFKNWNLDVGRLSRFIFGSVATGTFIVVSNFGAFSFLALLFPIVARRIFFHRSDLAGEVFGGALLNGFFFMVLDFLCYQFPILGAEIPTGLLATVLGAVSLIIILWSQNRGNSWQN